MLEGVVEASKGQLPSRVRWLIAAACAVTVVVVVEGMGSLWEYLEWGTHREPWWCTTAPTVVVTISIGVSLSFPFQLSRSLRTAVVLPFVHLGAIAAAVAIYSALSADVRARVPISADNIADLTPALVGVALGIPMLFGIAVAIKRRHGEWAHAAVMLSLSNLLLVGLWLPIAALLWVIEHAQPSTLVRFGAYRWRWRIRHMEWTHGTDAEFVALVVLPPLVLALAYTVLAFRKPRLFARLRSKLLLATKVLLGVAIFSVVSMHNGTALYYLKHVDVLLVAVVLAISALVTLTLATWVSSRATHRALREMPTQTGTIVDDGSGEPVASYEVTSWLRGPRLVARPFIVDTAHGDAPVSGAAIVAHVPATTTQLGIGNAAGVLAPGDRVVLAGGSDAAGGDPFRAAETASIGMVAAPGVSPDRFVDLALVAWRPAVAYLAILVAVAAPALVMMVT